MTVIWTIEKDLGADEFIDVLRRSGLAERRPVEDRKRIATMLENSNLIVTARDTDGLLIGVSRCVTDYAYCCYCSDLAVDRQWQGRGIGRELVRRSREAAGEGATFLLLSAPGVEDYYLNTGFERFETCYGIRRKG
ncbi:MAG: GNAT family N-acetyltransferase [Alphaproteobacteria bacterium]|nr:GNAT family N-acetyltransferase [Alphaproteobacteria bacterium]